MKVKFSKILNISESNIGMHWIPCHSVISIHQLECVLYRDQFDEIWLIKDIYRDAWKL